MSHRVPPKPWESGSSCRDQVYSERADKTRDECTDNQPPCEECAMQAITTSLSTCGREHAIRYRDGTYNSRLTQVQAETHTSADITLVTAQGDKVTLSTDATLQAA